MLQNMLSTLVLLSLLRLSHSLPDGLRTELTHVDAGSNYTKLELLQRMVHRSKTRARFLASTNTDLSENVVIPSFPSSSDNKTSHNEYLIKLSIGSPPQPFVLTLDTGSDLIWTQCQPLVHSFPQPYPIFNPKKSSTFSYTSCNFQLCNEIDISNPKCSMQNLCMYNSSYADGSYTSGFLARETFTLGSNAVLTNTYFGCGTDNTGVYKSNECGIAGFGRGTLSLISQLGYGQFAYCFTSFGESKSSPVLFGSTANISRYENGRIQSTPFFVNPLYPSFYYLYLNGITVGTMLLQIPPSTFAVKSDGSGGVIIDSGSALTTFPEAVYEMVKSAFVSQVKLQVIKGDMDMLCFSLPSASSQNFQPPKFIFHFEGADLELPLENYMHQEKEMACLAMLGDTSGSSLTVIANFQQQNFHVLYDLVGEQLSFVPAQCDLL